MFPEMENNLIIKQLTRVFQTIPIGIRPSTLNPDYWTFRDCCSVLPDGVSSYQIWVYFWGPWNGMCWYLWDHLVDLMALWYILWPFDTSFPVSKWRTKKNLATLRAAGGGGVCTRLFFQVSRPKRATQKNSYDAIDQGSLVQARETPTNAKDVP
jgi:hypothetical protein